VFDSGARFFHFLGLRQDVFFVFFYSSFWKEHSASFLSVALAKIKVISKRLVPSVASLLP